MLINFKIFKLSAVFITRIGFWIETAYSVSAVLEGYVDGEASVVTVLENEKTELNFNLSSE